ncbi:hypothetical protein KUT41_06540 [Pseudomonas aeruginosa]|nr:hypothetical protein [Pseudomonas aeruginosa]MBV5962576.1 hypothetical protein [Pseudomonas aeruginosa]
MAEVGDIDKVLDEILLLAFPSLTAEQAKSIFDRFHEGCQAQDASRIEKLRAFLEKPLAEEMISLSDSSKRWDNFNRLRKALPHLKGVDFGNYHEEVLAPRNFLAHGIPTKNENGGLIFSFHTKQYEFNSDVGKILRKTINQYKKKLIETHKIITTNQDNN